MKTTLKAGLLYEVRNPRQAQTSASPTERSFVLINGIRRDRKSGEIITVALIRCEKPSLPYQMPAEWFEERVALGEFVQVDTAANPAAPGIRCAEELADKERTAAFNQAVEENKSLIAPVLNLGWQAFDLHVRAKVLRQISAGSVDGKKHSLSWLRLLLWRYWTGGALALGPQYFRCGAFSRIEIAEQIRRGAPAKISCRPGPTATIIGKKRKAGVHDRGGSHIDATAEVVISSLIDDYFTDDLRKKQVQLSLERRHNQLPWTPITLYVNGRLGEMPQFRHIEASVAQVRYIGLRTTSIMDIMKKALGNRYMDLHHQKANGDSRDVAFFAGHRYEVDGVIADIHLVDDISGMPIGRPNIVLVVDTFSGMVVGVYFTVEDLNFAHVARALHCAFSPKPGWCRKVLGLEIQDHEWVPEGRCEHLTADNAQLITGAAAAVPELITDTGICPPYRPDGKGLVESMAELANLGVVHLFRYGVTKGPKERAKEDSAKDACVSLQTFGREYTRWIVDVANHRTLPTDRELDPGFLATRMEPTPFNYWNWSQGQHGGPPHAYNQGHWMPRLLERAQAKVTERGLELDGVTFDDPEAEDFKLMKAKATVGKVTYKPVHVDRLTTELIYLVPDDIKLPPRPILRSGHSRNCAGKTFGEVAAQLIYRKGLEKDANSAKIPRVHRQSQQQGAATKADLAAVVETHGSMSARNRKVKGKDLEKLKKDQAAADNAKMTLEIHGQAPGTKQPKGNSPSVTPSPARPSFLTS
jgi:hypothetical protein